MNTNATLIIDTIQNDADLYTEQHMIIWGRMARHTELYRWNALIGQAAERAQIELSEGDREDAMTRLMLRADLLDMTGLR